jgi:anti-sigma regulatory factor (Ser/Thr protein kinase)
VVPPAALRLRVTSDPAELAEVRRAIEAYAEAAGFGAEAVAEVGLVVNEAMANVIRHAYQNQPGQPIEVEAEPVPATSEISASGNGTAGNYGDGRPGDLRIRLRDWGVGVDPETAPKRGYIPGEPGGLGLVCLKQMMDRVEFARQPDGGMLLTMLKRRA